MEAIILYLSKMSIYIFFFKPFKAASTDNAASHLYSAAASGEGVMVKEVPFSMYSCIWEPKRSFANSPQ